VVVAASPVPADQPEEWELAPLTRRFGALVVDWILCVLISGFFAPLSDDPWPPLILVVEYAFFLGLFGQTPGMRVARIRCVSVRGGGPIGVPRAALRGVLLALVVPGLILDRYRRGLHDRAAGSVMLAA
jgi:uncharacterized RDD family membrane protein YckC